MRKIKNHHLLLGCAFGAQLLCATKGYSNKIEYADANRNGKVSYRYENAGKEFSGKGNMISLNNVQEKISGKVTGPDGKGIAGVSVQIKGARGGVISGAGGEFTIDAAQGDVLVFSTVGYDSKEVKVTGDNISVSLPLSSKQLTEVVVTALGIQRSAKSLTYAAQKVSNDELTTVKDLNFINSLSGKVAGVTITKSASGVGGSSRVILRGNKSTRENDPLYVIDGIPLQNYSPQQPTDVWGQSSGSGASGSDGGDGISNLNPDDIESLTVLKGASGAALYGSAAANGAILVTLKSGKAGKTHINVSSDITAESPLYYPLSQFKYGQGSSDTSTNIQPTDPNSWGPISNTADFVKPFFQTGVTTINSLSFTTGTDKSQTYLSYGNVSNKGIIPFSTLSRNNLTFRQTSKFLNDKLVADGTIMVLDQIADNRPVSGLYANPLTGLELFPRGLDFNYYKNNYTQFYAPRNVTLQNWYDINPDGTGGSDHEQNPYWVINKMPTNQHRDRALANLSLKYQINDWLNVQARGNFDKSWDVFTQKMYAGSQSVQSAPNGRYTYVSSNNSQFYSDLIVSANKKLSTDLTLQALVGTSITDNQLDALGFDEDPTAGNGLFYANQFGINEIDPNSMLIAQSSIHKQQQAVFASAELNYKSFLYLDLTGRNDWSSTFAFTPTENKGYFYYSAGANVILSQALTLPEAISFSKVRISYAKVGNDVSVYSTNPPQWTKQGNVNLTAQQNTVVPYPGTYLAPEDNRSFEVGTEWSFIQNRVGFDFTYYKNNNYQQYVLIQAPNGSGYTQYYLNLGNIQNTGFEVSAYVVPVQNHKLKWTSSFNFALNKNLVVSLSKPGVAGASASNPFILTGIGVNMYQSEIVQGGKWGDIYGYKFARAADGTILVDGTGSPSKMQTVAGQDSIGYLGNPNPTFTLGWNNTFNIGNFEVNFLIDGRFGGKVMSVTQAMLDQVGASKVSGQARDQGGVNIAATNSVTGKAFDGLLPAQAFYVGVGGRAGISEYYMYDATAVRLRELSLAYNIPVHVKGISNLNVSLIGRNLFFFYKKAPFDPEVSMATNNGLQGIETFGLPSTRSLGASVKIQF
jgi:TonB-linked SusC/RagA family outer membrane protein